MRCCNINKILKSCFLYSPWQIFFICTVKKTPQKTSSYRQNVARFLRNRGRWI